MANVTKRIVEFIKARPKLAERIAPISNSYLNLAGYRRVGLRYDDLIEEENDVVQEALKRLPADEMYKRSYRIRIAQQCGVTHTELPPEQWTKPEDDIRYLSPIVDQVHAEWAERIEMDSAVPVKKPKTSVGAAASQAWQAAKKTASPSH